MSGVTSNPARVHLHLHRPLGTKCVRVEARPCTACGWGLHADCFGKFCTCGHARPRR